jgi:hypothetical protein
MSDIDYEKDISEFHKKLENDYLERSSYFKNIHEDFFPYEKPLLNPKQHNSSLYFKIKKIISKKILLFKQTIKYIKFEISNIKKGKVTNDVFETRKAICLSCPSLLKSEKDSIGFCNSCGCGLNPRAKMSVKLTVSGSECPLKKWGKSDSVEFSWKNIVDSCIGICQTLWYNVKQLWQRN